MSEHRDIDWMVQTLKEPVRLAPDLDARIMAAVAAEAAHSAEVGEPIPLMQRLRRRTIRLSPLAATGMAAAIAAVALVGSMMLGPRWFTAPEPALSLAGEAVHVQQFVLVAPGAQSVTVVGDFNDWSLSATPLERAAGDGVWWVTVPLTPGRYRYAFVVDGATWQGDPDAPAADDEFGRPSSVVNVGGA